MLNNYKTEYLKTSHNIIKITNFISQSIDIPGYLMKNVYKIEVKFYFVCSKLKVF